MLSLTGSAATITMAAGHAANSPVLQKDRTMKRTTVRPGKSVVVSDEALAWARAALAAFGVCREQLTQLASFEGDVTIGPDSRGSQARCAHMARMLDNVVAADCHASVFTSSR